MIARVDQDKEVVARDAERVDDAMRQHWKTAVCKEFNVPSHYQSVAVLLIHWAQRFDEQLQCGAETAQLEEIFRLKYGFSTKTIVLDSRLKKPENQLHLETAKFVDEHDGHHRSNLIIVYYSGHGFKQKEDGVQQLWLSGTKYAKSTENETSPLYEPICRWKSADIHLQHAEADVLTIIDSCYASASTNKNARHETRSFEILAAADELTDRPGKSSFTHSLMKSLKELHGETVGTEPRPFDTNRLHRHVMKGMSSDHDVPPLFDRMDTLNARHIFLAPLVKTARQTLPRPQLAKGVLHLKVVFAKNRELNEEEITKLGTSLALAAKNTRLDIIDLDYVRFDCSPPKIRITIGVAMYLQDWIRNWRKKKGSRCDRTRDRIVHHERDQSNGERPTKRLRVDSPMEQ